MEKALTSRTPPTFATVLTGEDCTEPLESSHEDTEQRKPIVLVVDDDAAILKARSLVLEILGYNTVLADSGEKGLEIVRAGIADVVLLDYMMPGIDGIETARRMRELDGVIPIVLTSACPAVPKVAFELVNTFVPKTSPSIWLVDVIREQLRKRDVLRTSACQSQVVPFSTAPS